MNDPKLSKFLNEKYLSIYQKYINFRRNYTDLYAQKQ
jgi:hypothetical protein